MAEHTKIYMYGRILINGGIKMNGFNNEMEYRIHVIKQVCLECDSFHTCKNDDCPDFANAYAKAGAAIALTKLLDKHDFANKRAGCDWEREYTSFYCELNRLLGAHGLVTFDET